MKILLVSPQTPCTFWSFQNALRFISKKSSEPPLGLLTVAALLPEHFDKRLIDMNVDSLSDEHIEWADYVFLTGMTVQKDSFSHVVKRCNEMNRPVVAGGPMCTTDYEEIKTINHFVLNEAEITLPFFLKDLQNGKPEKIYKSNVFPDITDSPKPLWDLLEMRKYASMSVQYSRGCPYNCEFCSITVLNGHKPRTKSTEQFLIELDSLYKNGWRGNVFVVDDNFIGNKRKLKNDLLPALVDWSHRHHYPFTFMTETSITLADDDKLLDLMVSAGFDSAFIGIETPHEMSLAECGKLHNQNRDLVASVKKLQRRGIVVSGGFIVGFDSDPQTIFEQQIKFIQHSGIVTAMVGLLTAIPGTRLFQRLKSENRLVQATSGNNMDGMLNFVPKMNPTALLEGYRYILQSIYSHKEYYKRIKTFLKEYQPATLNSGSLTIRNIRAFIKSIVILGIREPGRLYYWKLILYSLLRYPRKFALAVTMAIYGFHFRHVIENVP